MLLLISFSLYIVHDVFYAMVTVVMSGIAVRKIIEKNDIEKRRLGLGAHPQMRE